MTIIHVTSNRLAIEETIAEMMSVSQVKALSLETLLQAVAMLPLRTCLHYDKFYGRWIFSTQDESEWPKPNLKQPHKSAHKVSGPNFTFADEHPEMAIARGVYYYYHTKVKE
jgi:hypothetical protein